MGEHKLPYLLTYLLVNTNDDNGAGDVLVIREGSSQTPAHDYSDFRFRTYAPVAFRYFRELFGIQPDDFLVRRFCLFKC